MPKRNTKVPTGCQDWSLNVDAESEKQFWWHPTYAISIWAASLRGLDSSTAEAARAATDVDVWRAYWAFQHFSVFRICGACHRPSTDLDNLADWRVCALCGATSHAACGVSLEEANVSPPSVLPSALEGVRWNVCRRCAGGGGSSDDAPLSATIEAEEDVPKEERARRALRHALRRAVTCQDEYEPSVRSEVAAIAEAAADPNLDRAEAEDLRRRLHDAMVLHFQPHGTTSWVSRRAVPSKGGGVGVFAARALPRFTIVGVYPGYDDPLSGEHATLGRPGPRYSLVDLNCADYNNDVFAELRGTHTPFFNEPLPEETSNCGWIQERRRPEGRLSVMTVRDVAEGEELLIGYGPLYPRTYAYCYDAYAFHPYEGGGDDDAGGGIFALWHWRGVGEEDAAFVCYIREEDGVYSYWQTEEEAEGAA